MPPEMSQGLCLCNEQRVQRLHSTLYMATAWHTVPQLLLHVTCIRKVPACPAAAEKKSCGEAKQSKCICPEACEVSRVHLVTLKIQTLALPAGTCPASAHDQHTLLDGLTREDEVHRGLAARCIEPQSAEGA